MAFLSLNKKTDTARRTTAGQRSITHLPAGSGMTEYLIPVEGCVGCAKWDTGVTHGCAQNIGVILPFGETRHQNFNDANIFNIDDEWKWRQGMWLLSYILHGVIDSIMYNAGAANNASDQLTYEIKSISGDTITVYGLNPKKLGIQFSSLNPDWPGTGSRLDYATNYAALPLGASISFGYPSVWFGRVRPVVKKITPPAGNGTNEEFVIQASCDCENALFPYDLKYPPVDGKYYLTLVYYGNFPETWPNLQAPRETSFVQKTVTLTKVQVDALSSGLYYFLNTDGNKSRILYPEWSSGLFSCRVRIGDEWSTLSDASATALLNTDQLSSTSWESSIDLAAFQGNASLHSVELTFWIEATAADGSVRLQWPAQCANCQKDLSGSYIHDTTDFCASVDSSQFATFNDSCWQPDCDGFCLGTESAGFNIGHMLCPPANLRLSKYWVDLWTRCSWYVEQLLAGYNTYSNWYIVRPSSGGPSWLEMFGGAIDEVPTGKFPTRWPLYSANFGTLETVTDGGGNESLVLRVGGFFERGTAADPQDAASTLQEGTIPAAIGATWDHTDATNSADTTRAPYPEGCGVCNIYSYTHGSNWLGHRCREMANLEAFATGVNLSEAEDTAVSASIRAWFA